MKLIIKTKNLELTPALENLAAKRMEKIKKTADAFQESCQLLVEVKRETKHHRKGDIFLAEGIIHLPGKKLVAKAHGENLGKIITSVRDELHRELTKYKTKTIDAPRRKSRRIKSGFIL